MIDRNSELYKKLQFEIEGNFYDLPVSDEDDDTISGRADSALNNLLVELENQGYKIIKNEQYNS